jgi:hypothetical protein
MRRLLLISAAALAALGGLVLAAGRGAATPAPAGIDPGNFVRTITNPYLPYRPGSVWV